MAAQLMDQHHFDYLVMRSILYWETEKELIKMCLPENKDSIRYTRGMRKAFEARAIELVMENITIRELQS
jgi:hypothetical protein